MSNLSQKSKFHLKDLLAGTVVFLVALPLCLGIALASGAPIMAGIIAGIIGGVVVGILSGSHISVAGPAAGLSALILMQVEQLGGNYAAFLLSVIFAGLLQLLFGVFKLGFFANFVPNNVILGLLAAIGVILISSQLPYLLGINELSWRHIAELSLAQIDLMAASIGILSLLVMLAWDASPLKKMLLPSALIAVVLAALLNFMLSKTLGVGIQTQNLIQLPNVLANPSAVFTLPDWCYLTEPLIYTGAITLAVVASLETLLNLEAANVQALRMDYYY